MINLTEAQWHMVAAADDVIEKDGCIVGVIFDGKEYLF